MEVMRMWWLFLLGLMFGGTVGMVVMCLFRLKNNETMGLLCKKALQPPFVYSLGNEET